MPRLFLAAVLMLALVHALEVPVFADSPSPGAPSRPWEGSREATTSVQSTARGVVVRIAVRESSSAEPDTPGLTSFDGSSSSESTWDCRVDVMNIGQAIRPWFEETAPLHPGHVPAGVTCTNGYFDVVWLPPGTDASDVTVVVDTGDPAIDPLLLVADLLEEIPVPDVAIGVNPSTGLVAVPSWFWIEGYDGTAISESASLGDITVEVEITPTAYHWRFGDGAEVSTTSLGLAYPEASDISHAYEQSSLVAGGAFPVSVDMTFDVRYRVVGELWEDLEPISRSFTYEYPVRQLQSVLTTE